MLSLRSRGSILASATGLVSIAALSGAAFAYEPGVPEATKGGVTIGIPAGALPPPGLYMNNNSFLYSVKFTDSHGNDTGLRGNAANYAPMLLWVPGTKLLGASYGAFVVQPYDLLEAHQGTFSLKNDVGFHNTFISPVNLSWNLGGGWFTSAGFGFYAPTGTICNGPTGTGGLPPVGTGCPGVDFWTFQPSWAISYLGNGWNATAHLYYEWNTENQRSHYTSGDVLYGDFTVTKKLGKWQFGPVAYFLTQTTRDRDPSGFYGGNALAADRKNQQFAIGGLIGYDFGPVQLNVIATEDLYSRSTSEGFSIMTNLSFRLWGPEGPRHTPLK